ncbi:MAG: hypothetical protein QW051_04855 [Candidatus Aenigmatarchaeota archaeon]
MFERERKRFQEFMGREGFLGVNSENEGFLGKNVVGRNAIPTATQEAPNRFAELNFSLQKRFFRKWR